MLQTFVQGFIPGYFRHGSVIRILKIQEPVIDDRWEDGEVSWVFNEKESDGNTTSVVLPSPPCDPLIPVEIKNGIFVYEIN
jgi:hypothetical protein